VGACCVSFASPHAVAAAALLHRVIVLEVWVSWPLLAVVAMPWLAWVARFWRVYTSAVSGTFSF
jgi:hypothetical protein